MEIVVKGRDLKPIPRRDFVKGNAFSCRLLSGCILTIYEGVDRIKDYKQNI